MEITLPKANACRAGEQEQGKNGTELPRSCCSPVCGSTPSVCPKEYWVGFLTQFYFQNIGKGFSTATGIYSMGQCSENINIFSASSIKPGLSGVEAEGTMTCISSGVVLTFLACLSTSHSGDKLRLVKSPSGHSAVSLVRCCACCFASFLCQSHIKDCESTSSSTPPCRPLHALQPCICFSTPGIFPVQNQRALPVCILVTLQFICTDSSALLCHSSLSTVQLWEMFNLLHRLQNIISQAHEPGC